MNAPRCHVVSLALALLLGCAQQEPPTDLEILEMRLGNKVFKLEIAETFGDQQRGLMRRDFLPADRGMIFVFKRDAVREFHMKNTRIPLDIIFIDSEGKIVSIKQMKPYDLTPTSSNYPARWAIELNKGAAEEAGLRVGDVVEIPDRVR